MAEAVTPGAVVGRIVARSLAQPDLVPLVEERHAGQREQEFSRRALVLAAEAGGQAAEVVVREHPGGLSGGKARLDRPAKLRRAPARMEQLERKGRVQVLEVGLPAGGRQVDLANQQSVAGRLANRRQRLADVRGVARVAERELGLRLAQG